MYVCMHVYLCVCIHMGGVVMGDMQRAATEEVGTNEWSEA